MRRNAIIDDYKKEYEALLKENEETGNEEEFDEKELIAFRKFAKRLKDFDTKHEKLKKWRFFKKHTLIKWRIFLVIRCSIFAVLYTLLVLSQQVTGKKSRSGE